MTVLLPAFQSSRIVSQLEGERYGIGAGGSAEGTTVDGMAVFEVKLPMHWPQAFNWPFEGFTTHCMQALL
jgi:hypothetical protein